MAPAEGKRSRPLAVMERPEESSAGMLLPPIRRPIIDPWILRTHPITDSQCTASPANQAKAPEDVPSLVCLGPLYLYAGTSNGRRQGPAAQEWKIRIRDRDTAHCQYRKNPSSNQGLHTISTTRKPPEPAAVSSSSSRKQAATVLVHARAPA